MQHSVLLVSTVSLTPDLLQSPASPFTASFVAHLESSTLGMVTMGDGEADDVVASICDELLTFVGT